MTVVRKTWGTREVHEYLQADWTDMPDLMRGDYIPLDSDGKQKPNNASVFKETKRCVKGTNAQWYGGIKSWAEVERFVRDGWPEGVLRARPMLDELQVLVTGRLESIKPFWKSDDNGSHHRWERELDGDHDVAWRRRVRRKTTGNNVISLGVQFGGHCGVTDKQYFWCGAQMAVAVDLLEQAGFEVEVRAIVLSHFDFSPTNTQIFEVVGKRAGDAPNLNNIMALTGHVGIYRTLGFLGFACGESNKGYGWGRDVTSGQNEMIARYVDDAPMDPFDAMLPLAYDEASAAKNVRAVLAKVGKTADVEIFDGAEGY